MRIVIAGAGAVGTHLAKMLSVENENVVLLDESEEKLGKMESLFDLQAIVGDPTKISALKSAGVDGAELFVAVTPDESRNITACILAHYLGAKKTIARIDNYEYLQPKHKAYFESLGVDTLIYPEQLAAEEIATNIKYSWMRQMLEFGDGALVMIGVKIRDNASIKDIPLKDFPNDIPYHVVAIQRGDETIIPRGNDMIKVNDLVCFMTTSDKIQYMRSVCGSFLQQKFSRRSKIVRLEFFLYYTQKELMVHAFYDTVDHICQFAFVIKFTQLIEIFSIVIVFQRVLNIAADRRINVFSCTLVITE